MKIVDGIIRVFGKKQETRRADTRPQVAAVVVAAGSSSRMGVPKQLIPLRGIPVIGRSLMALEAAELVDEIIVVAREEDMLQIYDICKSCELEKVSKILKGGATRQQSVARGVRAAKDSTEYFAIHDGARPLLRPAAADAVIEEAFRSGAAATAVRVKDTVKQTDENGFITATPDRRFLWNVQTPQVFERRLYLEALRHAEAAGMEYTDDCQLVEQIGHTVRLCEGDYSNIKLTTPEDVAFAEAYLRRGLDNAY